MTLIDPSNEHAALVRRAIYDDASPLALKAAAEAADIAMLHLEKQGTKDPPPPRKRPVRPDGTLEISSEELRRRAGARPRVIPGEDVVLT